MVVEEEGGICSCRYSGKDRYGTCGCDEAEVEVNRIPQVVNALDKQVGGRHYKDFVIQPIEYILTNDIPFLEANVIKYVSRWKDKNGVEDLEKAKHYIEILIERNKSST